jgi:hypothetical protein
MEVLVIGIRKRTLSLVALVVIFSSAALAGEASRATSDTQASDLWQQLSKIGAVNGQSSGYAAEVAISGQTVVVSSSLGNDGSMAYVFVKPAEGWTNMKLIARLRTTLAGVTGAGSVATDGDTVAIGAFQCSAGTCTKGAVLVFVKPPGGWIDMTQTATLTGSDTTPRDFFADSVSLSANTIVAGAYRANSEIGAAYVFVKPASGWRNMTQTAKLTPSDGAKHDFFGSSTAIDGNTIVIGSPQFYPSTGSGKAYVFVEPASGWQDMTQTAELTASDAFQNDEFGFSVGIKGGTVAVGAPGDSPGQFPGEAYVFVRSGTWSNMTETGKLTAIHASAYGSLGSALCVSDNYIAVSAPYDAFDGGSVFIFKKPTSGWANTSSKLKLFVVVGGSLGYSLAIDGPVVAALAPFSTARLPNVYLFQLLPNTAP